MKRLIYIIFGFENYLYILSKIYFFSYKLGLLKSKSEYKYHYYLRKEIKSGDVVIDIGANLGYFSTLFAQWVGEKGFVYSIEPIPEITNVLRYNLRNYQNVLILPFALGEKDQNITMINNSLEKFGYITSGRNSVYTSNETAGEKAKTFNAKMKRGSEMFKDVKKIDFIKCDVEGYELFILNDMIDIIKRHKPIVLLETEGEKRVQAVNFFTSIGYQGYLLNDNKLFKLIYYPDDTSDILFKIKESSA